MAKAPKAGKTPAPDTNPAAEAATTEEATMSDNTSTPATEATPEAAKPKKKVAEVTSVKMDDGRVVDFVGKRRLNKSASFDETNVYIRLDFSDGQTRLFKAAHGQTNTQDAKAKFAIKGLCHGLEQKLGDEISGVDSLDDAVEAIDQLMVRLERLEWNAPKESGDSLKGANILVRALMEVTNQPVEIVRSYLMGLDARTKKMLPFDPDVAKVIKRLETEKAEKLAAKGKGLPPIDTTAKLNALKAMTAPAAQAAA